MDTDAIYSAVCSYGTAKHCCWESDAEDTLSDIKRLLNEADAERKELLATNEKLVDEVAELRRLAAVEAELERIKANPVHQFRKSRCADWFDGHPDHTDGGGPYETRTLYALGSKTNG